MWSRKVTDTIGWVYEGDREKIRKAQDDLDDFYRQDNIDDLEATRDKEKELLDDRIEQIDLYLQALQYKAKEYERILRDQLLMEMMNADSMAEVKDKILLDWDEFNKGCDGSFKNYNGIFTNFMNEYRDNVLELDSIQKQMNDVLSSTLSGLMDTNNQNIQMGINNTSNIANAMGMSEADKQALAAAGRKYTIAQKAYLETNLAQYKQAMEQAHQQAEAIRAKYGYSGGIDGSALIVTDEGLYAQYMGGSGYKEQMETEEDFYNFYSDLFGDFNSAEGDRISDLRNYGNSLTSNYNSINSDGKSYVVGEENNLDDHRSNYYYQSDINDDIISNWLMYMDDANISYDYIIMDFESFIDKYRGMIEEYADLAGSIGNINPGTGGSSGGMEGDDYWMDKMTAADREALQAAGQKYNEALAMYQQTGLQYYKDMMEEAHAEAEAIRNKYGYSGGDDGSEWIPTNYTALSGSTMVGDNKYKGSMSASDQAALSQAGSDYNTYKELYEKTGNTQYKTLMNQAHDRAEEIRSKYGYSGGADGSLLLETTKNNYNQLNTIESERVGAYGSYISSIMGLQNKESSINLSSLSDFQNYISGTSSAYSTKNTLELTANANEAYNVSVHGDNAYEQAGINADIVNDWLMYNNDTQVQYDLVNMQFSDFLSKYAQQIQEYANLQSQLAGIMGGSMEIPGNVISGGANYGSGGSSGGGMKGDSAYSGAMSDYDKTMLSQAGADYNKYKQLYEQTGETKYKDMMNQAHDRAESIRNKYGYSGGVDGSENITIGSSKASTMSTVSALSSSLAMVPSSSSSSSSKKSSSSSKRGSAFEDVSNLPGGSYVQSDGTVYYPSGHPGAEIDLNRDGLPDSDWLEANDAPSWVTIGNIMTESGMSYEEAADYYKAKYQQGQDLSYDSISNNSHIASNKDQYLIQFAENAGWDKDQVDELINYLGNNGAEYNAELEAAISKFQEAIPKDSITTLNTTMNKVSNAIYQTSSIISSGTQQLADKLEQQGIIIAGTSQMKEYNSNDYQNSIREEMEKDQATMDYNEFVNKWGDKLVWNGDKMEMPLYGDYDITNGGYDKYGNPGYLGNSNATIGATGPSGTEWLGDKTFSQWLAQEGAPSWVIEAERLKENKQGIYWSADDYYQKNVMSEDDADALKEAGKAYTEAQKKYEETGNQIYKDLMDQAHEQAESIRNAYGYSGGTAGDEYLESIRDMADAESETNSDRISGLEAFGGDLEAMWDYINDATESGLANELVNNNQHEDNADDLANINKQLVDTWVKYNQDSKVQLDYANQDFNDFVNNYGSQIKDFANLNDELANNVNNSYQNIKDTMDSYNDLYDEWYNNYGSSGNYDTDRGEAVSPDKGYTGTDSSGGAVHPVGDGAAGGVTNSDGSWSPFPGGPVYSSPPKSSSSSSSSSSKKNSSSSSKGGIVGTAISTDSSGRVTVYDPDADTSMKRDTSKANTTVNTGKYTITYNKDGYATSKKKNYATGIENGPVNYTGLAMLHGTPSKPEYVLNNDQAYNLLYNLTTSRKPEIDNGDGSEVNAQTWNLYGDINIDGTEDPAEFWNTIMNSAGNRFNVTKSGSNRR